jgi:hypothetical protein
MPWHESVLEAELSKTKLVVNATAVGLVPGETPIPAELLPPDIFVIDLIYNPPLTQLLKDAAAAHDTTLGGELMLLQQGARAFELWTGKPAPVEVMQAELDRSREQGLRQFPVSMGQGDAASAAFASSPRVNRTAPLWRPRWKASRRACPSPPMRSRSTWPAASAAMAAGRAARPSSRIGRRFWRASATA